MKKNDRIITIARKKSSDPAQESLRASKDIFNSSTSDLISKLIAFKRGINGRGDAEQGIKPTKIQDPLPSELTTLLNKIMQDSNSLKQNAESIIHQQENYSKVRRKKSNMNFLGLEKEASWFGSRFMSNFQFGDPTRKLRLDLMSNFLELAKSLKDVKYLIKDSDDFSNLSASEAFNNAYLIYSSNIIYELRLLTDQVSPPSSGAAPTETSRRTSRSRGEGDETAGGEVARGREEGASRTAPAQRSRRRRSPAQNVNEEPKPEKERLDELQAIVRDSDVPLGLIIQRAEEPDKQKLKELQTIISGKYIGITQDTKIEDFNSLYTEITEAHQQALSIASRILGTELGSFEDASQLSSTSGSILQIQDNTIKKMAMLSLARNMITAKPKDIITNSVDTSIKLIDDILNQLEKRDLNLPSLLLKINSLNDVFITICSKLKNMIGPLLDKVSDQYDNLKYQVNMQIAEEHSRRMSDLYEARGRSSRARGINRENYSDLGDVRSHLNNLRLIESRLTNNFRLLSNIENKLLAYKNSVF